MSDSTSPGKSITASEEPVNFVADARLISVLGEQLIGSEKVGILELVKNAYDAGATTCTVTIEGVPGLQPSARSMPDYVDLQGPIIEIRDDGTGMTAELLKTAWLRPATPSRTAIKNRLRAERELAEKRGSLAEFNALVDRLKAAHGGRLPLGEKGIGRLATHRLGSFLWLRTKTADNDLEHELKIAWSDFDSSNGDLVDLNSILLTLRHQMPTTDYGQRNSGTVICCYGGRRGYEWTEAQLIDVGRAVNSLRSPRNAPAEFHPRFMTPHVSEAELASPLERVQAPFELVAVVDREGKAEMEILFLPPALLTETVTPFTETESVDLRASKIDRFRQPDNSLRRPECGPFLLHIRAWLRLQPWLGPDYKEVTTYLNEFGGVSVYRDGLATLPAQTAAKIDWLGLAQAQIKKSSNISYYHLSGEVEIQQENTLTLRDRSSREGLIETQAYHDLAALTQGAVRHLQFYMQATRRNWLKMRVREVSSETVKTYARIASNLGDALAKHYDFDGDPLKLTKVLGDNPFERLTAATEIFRRFGEQLELHEGERDGLLEAAGFGIAIGVGLHELARLATAVVLEIKEIRKIIPEYKGRRIESVETAAESLLSEIKRLAPLRVTRAETPRPFSIKAAVEAAKNAFVRTLDDRKIQVQINAEDFRVQGRFGALAQVFANLFDNSIYWIGTLGSPGVIRVVVSASKRTVLVADSGPGVSQKMMAHLFEPFFSERNPPSGLGLYICRYYLGQCRASIRLAQPVERDPLSGAQFLLNFSKSRVGVEE